MILVTGGCGYIGSHTIIDLLDHNYEVVCIDNLYNSSVSVVEKIKKITNKNFNFHEGDIRDKKFLNRIFNNYSIDSVIHFAGLKSLEESYSKSLDYFSNNVNGTICLIEEMEKANIYTLIFSSSATVYGNKFPLPWHEELELSMPISPYAQTKFTVENYLKEKSHDKKWQFGLLRYFNPIGAHKSGLIGDNNYLFSSNLVPNIIKVIRGDAPYLEIFGKDYKTPDGTGIRDYIHISDLVEGHLKALGFIKNNNGCHIWNLGSGKGYSVLEIVECFELLSNSKIQIEISDRREGDLDKYWANISKAENELRFVAKKNLNSMVKDTLNFVKLLNDR